MPAVEDSDSFNRAREQQPAVPSPSPNTSQPNSRPSSGRAGGTDANKKADKLATIGLMLREQGEHDALRYLCKSLHLNPAAASVWKSLGHGLAQDGLTAAACSALQAAAALAPPGQDAAARTGLATMLTQSGLPGAAADELLTIRSIDANAGAASLTAEPLERLCRRLMPGHRFSSVQSVTRALAWRQAINLTFTRIPRVIDVSSTPLPAMLCAQLVGDSEQIVLRVEGLPWSVTKQALQDNRLEDKVQLIAAGPDGLPRVLQDVMRHGEPEALLADSDTHDILASPFLSTICAMRRSLFAQPKPVVVPNILEVHAAVVESEELAQLNSISSPICGFNLDALNALSHRTRAVQLSKLKHTILTKACTPLRVKLDAQALPKGEGQVSLPMQVERNGTAHAVVVWHTMRLHKTDKNLVISTAPNATEEADGSVRQVAYYLWSALPGEPDWERQVAEAADTAAAAAEAADRARSAASAAHAAAAAASVVAEGCAHAANYAVELAAEAEQKTEGARGRIQYGAKPEHHDAYLLECAAAAAQAVETTQQAADHAAAMAHNARIAAGAADEAASKAADASRMAAAAAAKVSDDDAPFETAAAELAAWAEAQQAAAATEAAARAAHEVGLVAKDAEPPFGEADDDEEHEVEAAPAEAAQDSGPGPTKVTDDGEEGEGDEEEADVSAAAEASAAAASAADQVAQEAERKAQVRAARAERAARFAAAAAARQASEDAAGAASAIAQGSSAAANARSSRGIAAKPNVGEDGAAAPPPSLSSVYLKKAQALTLRMRYKPGRVEFQLCGHKEHRADEVDTTKATGPQPRGATKPLMDVEGRIITASGRLYVVTAKLRVRVGVALDSDEAGIILKGTRVRVLERRPVKDANDAQEDDEGILRALVQQKDSDAPSGWLSCRTKEGEETLLPVEDPRAAQYPEPPPVPPSDSLDAKLPEWMRSNKPGSEKAKAEAEARLAAAAAPSEAEARKVSVLLARTAPEVTRVSEQNFGSPSARAPLGAYHFPMLNDSKRNHAFACGIIKAVNSIQPSLVLDIGCGTGLLAMIAASKAGASRVLAVEMTPELAAIASQLVASHGLSHSVRVLQCHSSQLSLDTAHDPWQQRADLLVFEILGTDPLCEGLLPTLRDARSRLLTQDAIVLPCALEVHVMLVESDKLARLNSVLGSAGGINLGALNTMSHRTRAVRLSELPHTALTKVQTALRLQLDAAEPPDLEGQTEIEMSAVANGTAHAVICWFTAHLDTSSSITVSTAPGVAEPMRGHSWGQSAHFLPAGLQMHEHQTYRLRTRWSDKGLSFEVIVTQRKVQQRETANLARAIVGELVQIERHVNFGPAPVPISSEAQDGEPQALAPGEEPEEEPKKRYVLSSDATRQSSLVPEPPKTPKKPSGPVQFKRSASGKYRSGRSGMPGEPSA